MNKKRSTVLFFAQSVDSRRGPDGFIVDWVRELAKRTEKLVVLTYYHNPNDKLPVNTKVVVIGGNNFLSRNLNLFCKSIYLVITMNVDVVFAHILEVFGICGGVIGRVFRRKCYFWYCQPYDLTNNYLARLAFLFVDKILTCASQTKERYIFQTGIRAEKITVVGHGINIKHYTAGKNIAWPKDNQSIKVLYLGRGSPIKDLPTLDRAVEILKDRGLKIKYFKIGTGKESVSYAKNSYVYKSANIFVNPSRAKALDKTLLEALASGVIAIGSDEAYPVFKNKFPNLVFMAGDSVDLANKISRLIECPEERLFTLRSARAYVVRNYNLKKLFDKIETEIW